MPQWVDACATDEEDVIRWDHGGRTYAIYHSPDGEFFCTDGMCTHEKVHLAGGLVMDHVIECPKHNGQFDYRTGKGLRAPVCVNLATYPARAEGGRVLWWHGAFRAARARRLAAQQGTAAEGSAGQGWRVGRRGTGRAPRRPRRPRRLARGVPVRRFPA